MVFEEYSRGHIAAQSVDSFPRSIALTVRRRHCAYSHSLRCAVLGGLLCCGSALLMVCIGVGGWWWWRQGFEELRRLGLIVEHDSGSEGTALAATGMNSLARKQFSKVKPLQRRRRRAAAPVQVRLAVEEDELKRAFEAMSDRPSWLERWALQWIQ